MSYLDSQLSLAKEEIRKLYWQAKDAGSYSDEACFGENTDKYNMRAIKVECPYCFSRLSPFASKKTVELESGWYWVGCDYKEPRSKHGSTCNACKKLYIFWVYTPQ